MEIRRFGIGHRRGEGPAGTHGVEGQSIHADDRGAIVELAFRPRAAMAPHSNPNLTYFLVIEGGGFVQVGDERARVAAGEAVVWPPDVAHAAWTEETPMRALVVEFAVEGRPAPALEEREIGDAIGPAEHGVRRSTAPVPADGGVVRMSPDRLADRDSPEREPW